MIKVGDVFEIKTAIGHAYFQFVKKIPPMGSLIRVLPGTYSEPIDDLSDLIQMKTNFWIFFPIAAAVKNGVVRKVERYDVPPHSKETPIFRTGLVNPESKRVDVWWFWDGEKEWKVGTITEKQRELPIRGTWNDTMLIERIEKGWRPENDYR